MENVFLNELIRGADLQKLADMSEDYLSFPLVVRNYARDTLCCSKSYPMDDLTDRENRHASILRQSGTDNDLSLPEFIEHMGTGKPYMRMYPYLRRARLFCGCVHMGVPVGYVMVPGTERAFSALDRGRLMDVASIFAAALVLRGHPCRQRQDEDTSLLWDILSSNDEPPVPRLSLMHRPFDGLESFRLLWIPKSDELDPAAEQLLALFTKKWYVVLQDGMAVLISGKEELNEAANLLKTHEKVAGCSAVFFSVTSVRDACEQARTAADYGQSIYGTPMLYDFARYELLNTVINSIKALPKPPGLMMNRIREYDENNSTRYLDTIKAYAECGMDALRAGNTLGVHRNTVTYRLDRIKELFGLDTDDLLDMSSIYWQLLLEKAAI